MLYPMPFAYVNHAFVLAEEAQVSILERGFRFGDGIFETIRIFRSTPYQWESHLARINAGLQALRIPFDTETLFPLIQELIARNQQKDGFVRLSISRGIGSRGYLPVTTESSALLVIETTPAATVPEEAVPLWLSRYQKPAPEALPVACKLMQGVNPTLARMEAADNHCFEALQLGNQGQVCEGSSSNIFWVKEGVLHTPSLASGILAGTVREAVLRLSPLPVNEAIFTLDSLQTAEEVFMTNTAWLVLPVVSLAPLGWAWQAHSVASRLRTLIEEDMVRYAERHTA